MCVSVYVYIYNLSIAFMEIRFAINSIEPDHLDYTGKQNEVTSSYNFLSFICKPIISLCHIYNQEREIGECGIHCHGYIEG